MTGVLVLCTANLCRSVMAEPLLAARLTTLGHQVTVGSAGMTGQGAPPPAGAIAALASRGHDISGHRSRRARPADLAAADLILGMTREHVRHAVVMLPAAWPRTFTLKELVRRGRRTGPRGAGQSLPSWLARVAESRDHRDLFGASDEDDLADPFGGTAEEYEFTAQLLDQLTGELVDLCWGCTLGG
jgi:protein-tyrosine phosphatase